MESAVALIALFLTANLSPTPAQDVRAVDHYIYDTAPVAGIGVGEAPPRTNSPMKSATPNARKPEVVQRSSSDDARFTSKETEDTISYVEDLLAGRENPSRDTQDALLTPGGREERPRLVTSTGYSKVGTPDRHTTARSTQRDYPRGDQRDSEPPRRNEEKVRVVADGSSREATRNTGVGLSKNDDRPVGSTTVVPKDSGLPRRVEESVRTSVSGSSRETIGNAAAERPRNDPRDVAPSRTREDHPNIRSESDESRGTVSGKTRVGVQNPVSPGREVQDRNVADMGSTRDNNRNVGPIYHPEEERGVSSQGSYSGNVGGDTRDSGNSNFRITEMNPPRTATAHDTRGGMLDHSRDEVRDHSRDAMIGHSRDTNADHLRDGVDGHSRDKVDYHPRNNAADHSRNTGTSNSRGTTLDDSRERVDYRPRDTAADHSRNTGTSNSRGTTLDDSRERVDYRPRDTAADHSRNTGTSNSRGTTLDDSRERVDYRPRDTAADHSRNTGTSNSRGTTLDDSRERVDVPSRATMQDRTRDNIDVPYRATTVGYHRETVDEKSRRGSDLTRDQEYSRDGAEERPNYSSRDSEFEEPESFSFDRDDRESEDEDIDAAHSSRPLPKTQRPRQAPERRGARGPHPASPCPSVFSYEGTRAGKERWYGVVLVTTDATLTGLRLEVSLDKRADLLGSWLGEVSSVDNIRYTIWNGRRKVVPGPPLSVKIFVKYNEQEYEPPRVRSIRLNGRQICPQERAPAVPPRVEQPSRPNQPGGVRPVQKPNRPANAGVQNPKGQQGNVPDQATAPAELVDGVACGRIEVQPSPLITYGQRTARGQWPWHAAIYQSKGTDLSYVCGGSLIGKRTVLTAAHCVSRRYIDRPVDAESLVVYFGKYHLKLWSEGGVQDKQVLEVHLHPEYNSTDFRADIAILILSSPVEFTVFVKPVCLWDKNRSDLNEVEGYDGVVVGWGYDERGMVTEELMMAKMPVVSHQTCIWSYPQFFSQFTSDRTYCAGFRNGTSVCNGDSGGGMVFPKLIGRGVPNEKSVTWALRGIVSLSTSQANKRVCNTDHYVVFTDIVKFYDWMKKYH